MPLVRVDLRKGKPAAHKKAIADGVYRAMREAFNVPDEDRFIVINEHDDDQFDYSDKYLGIERTGDLVIIQITANVGRTVEQKYAGKSRWPFLKKLKEQYPDRTILGSGDVFTAEDAVRMLRETGVDMVWIARGAIGNPWIFDHARRLLAEPDTKLDPPTMPGGFRNRRRLMVAVPDQNLILLENYVNPTDRLPDAEREQQIWTYRVSATKKDTKPQAEKRNRKEPPLIEDATVSVLSPKEVRVSWVPSTVNDVV